MRLLLDTHALLWWLSGDEALSMRARTAIDDQANDIFVSAASAREITAKHHLGKRPKAEVIAAAVEAAVLGQGSSACRSRPVTARSPDVWLALTKTLSTGC